MGNTQEFKGTLEVDTRRGVIYFHDEDVGITRLRICGLELPAQFESVDVTHMIGVGVVRKD